MRCERSRSASRHKGFTIIELMIVVGVVGILAAIALPSYGDYIRRGQLPEAHGRLADYAAKMEQYYLDHRNYGTAACADVDGTGSWKSFIPEGTSRFTYTCAAGDAGVGWQGFTVTATGASGRAIGHAYTVTHTGVQGTTNFKGSASAKACWLIKGNEC